MAQYLEDDVSSFSSGGGDTNKRRKKGSGDNYFIRSEATKKWSWCCVSMGCLPVVFCL